MANKKSSDHNQMKKTLQFWASQHDIKPFVVEALKTEYGLKNTSRIEQEVFKTMLNDWLSNPASPTSVRRVEKGVTS